MPTYPITIRRCQHIKVNGIQCGSPAKRNEMHCYFHEQCRLMSREINMKFTEHGIIKLPTLEDANSIQLGLAEVMRLLVTHQIDHKIASLLLRALRIAAANLKFLSLEPPPTQIVIDPQSVADRPLGATAWSTVEGQDYDLIQNHNQAQVHDQVHDQVKDDTEDTQEPGHHPAETASSGWVPTPELSQVEMDILRLDAEGKYAEADEIRCKEEPFFRLNPSSRARTARQVPAGNPENSKHDPEPSKATDGLTVTAKEAGVGQLLIPQYFP
jgi:hypothetical protein